MPLHPFEFLEFSVPREALSRLGAYRENTVIEKLFYEPNGLTHEECRQALHAEVFNWGILYPEEVPLDKLSVLNHRLANLLFTEEELQKFMAESFLSKRRQVFLDLVERLCPVVQSSAPSDGLEGLEAQVEKSEARAQTDEERQSWPAELREYVEWLEEQVKAKGDAPFTPSELPLFDIVVGEDFATFSQNARLVFGGRRYMLHTMRQTESEDMPSGARRNIHLTFIELGPV